VLVRRDAELAQFRAAAATAVARSRGLSALTCGDAGGVAIERADRTAIEAYRRRLADLEDECGEAAAMHDPVRVERAAVERDALLDELAGALDSVGRGCGTARRVVAP
jgi:hypothetical protein